MKSLMSFIANRSRLLARLAFPVVVTSLLLACNTAFPNRVEAGPIYSAITVDVEPVRAKNIGEYADKIGAYLKQGLAKTYAGAVDSKNKSLPTLTVEVHSIYFGVYASDFSGNMGMNQPIMPHFRSANDTLDGYAVIRKGGKEIHRENIYVTNERRDRNPISSMDDEERLIELTQRYANELRRELGD
jgi:hypothetical protein